MRLCPDDTFHSWIIDEKKLFLLDQNYEQNNMLLYVIVVTGKVGTEIEK